jgi:DNA-binding CsgD family transcriptional regulator
MSRQLSLARLREISALAAAGAKSVRLSAEHEGMPAETLRLRLIGLRLPTRHTALLGHREAQVVALKADGMTAVAIGARLGIQPGTVRSVLYQANAKINAAMAGEPVFYLEAGRDEWREPAEAWPAEQVERFRALIAGGASIAAAGRAVGRSKNAAAGKWHRIRKQETGR